MAVILGDSGAITTLTPAAILRWCAAGLLCYVIGLLVHRRFLSALADVPGPALSRYTVLWRCWHILGGHEERWVMEMHRRYGPFVRISPNEVSVGHSDGVQILQAKLWKSPFYDTFAVPTPAHYNQVSERDPVAHARKRRHIAAGYTLTNLLQSEAHVDAVLRDLEAQLDRFAEGKRPKEDVHFDRWFIYMTFDVVGELTFSRRFGFVEEGRDVGGAIANSRYLLLYCALAGRSPVLHRLLLGNPLLAYFGIQPANHIMDTCTAAVQARLSNDSARRDMMERWLEVKREKGDAMADQEILGAAIQNLAAGADTIAATLQACTYYLLKHPYHLRRLREELDTAQTRGELSEIVSHAEAQRLPFLQACIKETYRFHSGISLNLSRVAPKGGITIGERFFPEGVILSIHPWVLHRDPALFGVDADSFNPERWLDPERAVFMDRYLIHWGGGWNSCSGRHLAHMELSKILSTLFRDYDIELRDPEAEWKFESWIVAFPHDWPCRVRRRFRWSGKTDVEEGKEREPVLEEKQA